MKIAEAQAMYRDYQKDLSMKRKSLLEQIEEAKEQYEKTGLSEYEEQGVSLELSYQEVQKAYEKNQEVLESLGMQHMLQFNAEVAAQQADAEKKAAGEYAKIMTVARRIAKGDEVPYYDEKKLMEYDKDLYLSAKNAQMMHYAEKHKKHKSLWEEEEEEKHFDPEGRADNATAQGELPEIQSDLVAVETGETESE